MRFRFVAQNVRDQSYAPKVLSESMTSKRVVSLPCRLFERLEASRKRMGLSRSGAVQLALDAWLAEEDSARLVAEYRDGYRRLPERAADAKAWLSSEGWPPRPKRT